MPRATPAAAGPSWARWRGVGRRAAVISRPHTLELASDLGNVSEACRVTAYSRPQFCEIRRIARRGGTCQAITPSVPPVMPLLPLRRLTGIGSVARAFGSLVTR